MKSLILLILVFLVACTVVHHRDAQEGTVEHTVEKGEQFLSADQKAIEELREKNIHQAKREENDQLKEILSLMGEVKEHPSKIRSKFNRELSKRRTKFRKETSKERKDFTKNERKAREQFLKTLKEERKEFLKNSEVTREQRKEFFDGQDEQRKTFMANQKDKRADFEGRFRERSKDFNANIREHQKHFSQELRNYQKRYNEWKKEQREAAKKSRQSYSSNLNSSHQRQLGASAAGDLPLEDKKVFQQMNQIPGQKLKSE